jgi:hypothetical protein
MTQKNTAQTAKSKAGTGADAIVADAGINRGLEIDSPSQDLSEQPTTAQIDAPTIKSSKRPNLAAVVHGVSHATSLSPEIIELVAELRDTVRRINPSKHTPKTLRRSLSNVRDILDDINALDTEH